jgi:thiol-disulfide isomerase/thioredoxin
MKFTNILFMVFLRSISRNLKHLFICGIAVSAAPAVAAPGESAPDFNLPGRTQTVNLASLRGKVIYLDFWASWCQPCRASFPWMNSMQKRYADQGLVVMAVNLDKSRELSDAFLKDVPAEFTIAYDPEGRVATAYRVKGMPSSYLIDRQGRIHSSHVGFREENIGSTQSAIESLLKQH